MNRTGTIADLRHLVILMQENRSFDHYFGTLRGVRGFGDRQALRYPGGTTVFQQPDKSRADGGYLLPFRMNSAVTDALNAGELDHSWDGDHRARGDGRWDNWVAAKTWPTMGYLTRADLPFYYALADAYTICDGYHPSVFGPTSPNRMYLWAGTSSGWTDNPPDYTPVIDGVTTYPERLLDAGVSWRVYASREVGNGPGDDTWVGDYGDNPLWFYRQYHDSMSARTPAARRLADLGSVQPWQPRAGAPLGPGHVRHVLGRFLADCAAGTLPRVSWLVAPYSYCEHAPASPSYGEHYVRTVLDGLAAHRALWESSALLLTYDEHEGFFDHALPPVPEPGEPGEFAGGRPLGPGPRVPMLVCSPWSRGGFVDSNTYDHTSVLRLLETWTGVPAPGISRWRRSVTGDLTAAFDFGRPDFSVPVLPDTVPLIARSDRQKSYPALTPPAPGTQAMPAQEPGRRPHRPSRHQPHADVTVDRAAGTVTATLTNDGPVGASLLVVAGRPGEPASVTPFTVLRGAPRSYGAVLDGRCYAFSVYGPDRFVRSFTGQLAPAAGAPAAGAPAAGAPAAGAPVAGAPARLPRVCAALVAGPAPGLQLTLASDGTAPVGYTLTPLDYAGRTQHVAAAAGRAVTVRWPADEDGYYDVAVTADSGDGFTRRYAGRIA